MWYNLLTSSVGTRIISTDICSLLTALLVVIRKAAGSTIGWVKLKQAMLNSCLLSKYSKCEALHRPMKLPLPLLLDVLNRALLCVFADVIPRFFDKFMILLGEWCYRYTAVPNCASNRPKLRIVAASAFRIGCSPRDFNPKLEIIGLTWLPRITCRRVSQGRKHCLLQYRSHRY